MIWPFRRKRKAVVEIDRNEWLRQYNSMQPPISIADHLAAKERIAAAQAQGRWVKFGDADPVWVMTGEIRMSDLKLANGYSVVVHAKGCEIDMFGWPKGDPRSPASLTTGTA